MSREERDAYLAKRDEADRAADFRRAEGEHRRHQIGVALIWFATLVRDADIRVRTSYWSNSHG